MAGFRRGFRLDIDNVIITDAVEVSLPQREKEYLTKRQAGVLGEVEYGLDGNYVIGECVIKADTMQDIKQFDDNTKHRFTIYTKDLFENTGTGAKTYDIHKYVFWAEIGILNHMTATKDEMDGYEITLKDIAEQAEFINNKETFFLNRKQGKCRINGISVAIDYTV